MSPQFSEKSMGLRQVLAVGPLPLKQVRHRIQTNPVNPHCQPVIDHLQHLCLHLGIIKVQIRLVTVETMPVVGLGHRVPVPVGGLEILEDDPGLAVPLRCIAPDIILTVR